jgi:undecaprenyl diphosphate synthase
MSQPLPQSFHVAMIMDGNGRWAAARGLPRVAGHRAGARTVRRIVEAAPGLGITTLTLYAFSEDNWSRPEREVSALMKLLGRYLMMETDRCVANSVRLNAIGRRDRLPAPLLAMLQEAEQKTAKGKRLHLRLAIDYSARSAIRDAFRNAGADASDAELSRHLGPDVDLLLRTSGEQRLSDFLLWECAYAEMVFTERKWPELSIEDVASAVAEFRRRERRFGALSPEEARRTA